MKMISNFGIFYRLLVLSTTIFLFGCQTVPDTDNDVIKPPDWINQKEFVEFPKNRYFVAVGSSSISFEDARLQAFKEIQLDINRYIWHGFVSSLGTANIKERFEKVASTIPSEYFKYVHGNLTFGDSIMFDYDGIYGYPFLDNTMVEATQSKHPSWAELCTTEQDRFEDNYGYYVLITFDFEKAWNESYKLFIDMYKKGKESDNIDFLEAYENLFATIQLIQKIRFTWQTFRKYEREQYDKDGFPKDGWIKDTNFFDLTKEFDTRFDNLYKDFEVKFSKDSIETQRDKFSEKIDIQVFWKKKLIKVPLCFETSTDAQVELIESKKDDVSYEMRIMPLSVSNRKNKTGEYYIEFNFKPEGLRFMDIVNFSLKKKFHFQVIDEKK